MSSILPARLCRLFFINAMIVLKTHDRISLWPDEIAPGSERLSITLTITERSKDPFWPDRILTGITRPSLTAFVPASPNGAAMIVAPGGAYGRIVLDKEAAEMALWLNTLGIYAFLLQYRLPGEGHAVGPEAPLADAQRALRVLRQNAAGWGLDPARIGFLGCSAGGHLGAMLGTRFDRPAYDAVDAADRLTARPDCMLLLYPVVSMNAPCVHDESCRNLLGSTPSATQIDRYSAELQLPSGVPPAFIAVADDDNVVAPENSRRFHQALREAGCESHLHVFTSGGHGFGIRDARDTPAARWTGLAAQWLADNGFAGADTCAFFGGEAPEV